MALKIQPQTLKSSYIKLIALLYSSIAIPLIFFIPGSPMIILFIILACVYLITAIIYMLVRNVRRNCKCLKVVWLVDIAYIFGGLLYYFGRIIPYTVIQTGLLGTAAILFRFIPYFVSKYYQTNLAKEHKTTEAKLQLVPEWILAAESLALLVDFDAWYTVMVNSFYQGCSDYEAAFNNREAQIASWVVWAFLVLMYMIILYYTMNIQYFRNYSVNISCIASNFFAIVPVAAFGMHLLTKLTHRTPLQGPNASIATLVMTILVLIVVIAVIVLLLVYRCLSKTRQEKLLPRALYQHLHPEQDEQELTLGTENTDDIDTKSIES